MKIALLTIFVFFVSSNSFSQTAEYNSLSKKADSLFLIQDFKESIIYY